MKTHLLLCNLKTKKLGAYEMFLGSFAKDLKPDRLVVALAGIESDKVAKYFNEKGVDVEFIPKWQKNGVPKPWSIVLGALRLFYKWNPDTVAVHFGNEIPTIFAKILATLIGGHARWIWHQHQQIQNPSRFTRWFNKLRLLSCFIDHFVAVYDGGRVSLEKRGIPRRKITVVHNGMVDHKVSVSHLENLRESLDITNDTNIVITVGWLVKRKRIDWLLDAWREVVRQLPEVRSKLLIVGDGPERKSLNNLVQEYGINDSVVFLGERDDVRDLLALGDVYAHTSIAETCTYTITESMCAGIPAVVTEAGAAREQIQDGISGYITKTEDMTLFTSYIIKLLSFENIRCEMGRKARAGWQKKYFLRNSIRPLLELYYSMMRRCI